MEGSSVSGSVLRAVDCGVCVEAALPILGWRKRGEKTPAPISEVPGARLGYLSILAESCTPVTIMSQSSGTLFNPPQCLAGHMV